MCERVVLPDGTVMIVCRRGHRGKNYERQRRCKACSRPATALCDAPVPGGTCDAPCCATHSTHYGSDLDYCWLHAREVACGERPAPSEGS